MPTKPTAPGPVLTKLVGGNGVGAGVLGAVKVIDLAQFVEVTVWSVPLTLNVAETVTL
jgi:hypothetical protein